MASGSERAHWDEAAALEELERLQRGIEEWRRRRKDVQAEFDGFVRGFRRTGQVPEVTGSARSEGPPMPPPSSVPVSLQVQSPASATPAAETTPTATLITAAPTQIALEEAARPLPANAGLPPIPTVAAGAPAFRSSGAAVGSALTAWLANQSTRRSRVVAGAGALAILVVAGALVTHPWQTGPEESPRRRSASVSTSNSSASQRAVPAASQPASQPADAGAPRSEILALERVWVRVVVDGTREVERELAAGERIPLRAGRASVIRAGNAGAVRVTINGEDRGTLGPEGEPITRTLRAPAAPAR